MLGSIRVKPAKTALNCGTADRSECQSAPFFCKPARITHSSTQILTQDKGAESCTSARIKETTTASWY